jgi:uncharacterized protein (DUF2141 family)
MPKIPRFARGIKGDFTIFAHREMRVAAFHEADGVLHVSSIPPAKFSAIVVLFQSRDINLETKMKRTYKNIILATLLATTISTAALSGSALADETFSKEGVTGEANITVTLNGIKDIQGVITAGLYNSENAYKKGGTVRGARTDVKADTVTFSYTNLPDGEYAIKLFHDVDGDGEMGSNLFGIPTEPFAFSNNAVGMMGPAKWADAKFTVSGSKTTQAITLN